MPTPRALFLLFISVLLLFALAAVAPLSTAAQGTPTPTNCKPADVLKKAAALSSTGDDQKDLAALLTFANDISALRVACLAPAKSNAPLPLVDVEKFGSRQNPVPRGFAVSLVYDKTMHFEIGVVEVIRGDEAWKRIRAANQFNDAPKPDQEYVLVRFIVNYVDGPTDAPYELDSYYAFKSVTMMQMMRSPSVASMSSDIELKLFPGGRASIWAAKFVQKDDPTPLLVLGSDDNGKGGFYFAISK